MAFRFKDIDIHNSLSSLAQSAGSHFFRDLAFVITDRMTEMRVGKFEDLNPKEDFLILYDLGGTIELSVKFTAADVEEYRADWEADWPD